jgi:hypothetical protein
MMLVDSNGGRDASLLHAASDDYSQLEGFGGDKHGILEEAWHGLNRKRVRTRYDFLMMLILFLLPFTNRRHPLSLGVGMYQTSLRLCALWTALCLIMRKLPCFV